MRLFYWFLLPTLLLHFYFTFEIFLINFLIHHLFCISKDGEPVEFEVMTEPNGRSKAFNVTGPDGSYVQGAPRRTQYNDFGHDEGGYQWIQINTKFKIQVFVWLLMTVTVEYVMLLPNNLSNSHNIKKWCLSSWELGGWQKYPRQNWLKTEANVI